jgi:hypothetical protein
MAQAARTRNVPLVSRLAIVAGIESIAYVVYMVTKEPLAAVVSGVVLLVPVRQALRSTRHGDAPVPLRLLMLVGAASAGWLSYVGLGKVNPTPPRSQEVNVNLIGGVGVGFTIFMLGVTSLSDFLNREKLRVRRRSRRLPKKVIGQVWHRDKGRCAKCGTDNGLHIDHIIPVAKGGGHDLNNLQLLCARHNLGKGDRL